MTRELDWAVATRSLDELGVDPLGQVLDAEQCRSLVALYADAARFRATIDMARHRFGEGEYRYFAQPLPELVTELRAGFWPHLMAIARTWAGRRGDPAPWPDEFED